MQSKTISLLIAVQTLTLGFALLCAASAARAAERYSEGVDHLLPVPDLNRYASYFRDYGWWCFFLIVAWTALAFRSQRAQSTYYPLKTFGGGAFLIVAFSIAAIAFAFGALLPLQTN